MKYESLIVIGILLLAALILGSELKSIVPELLKSANFGKGKCDSGGKEGKVDD